MDGEDFEDIGAAFEAEYPVSLGKLGEGQIRLMDQRQVVDFAVKWIEANRK